MKPFLQILAIIATIGSTTEATDPAALINLKSQIGNLVLNAATSVIQAQQNLVRSSTAAIINAKTNFIQRQLPHFVQFKSNQINSVLELKKNLLKSKIASLGQLASGNAIQAAEQDVAPYSPPVAPPPAATEEPIPYSPQPPLQTLPPPAPPAETPLLPYPPPSPLAKRQLTTRQSQSPINHAQPSYQLQNAISYGSRYNKIQHSNYPTPPPQPPVRHVQYV